MKKSTLNFEDFQVEKLTKNQQKTVRGGDGEEDGDPNDPCKAGGKGNGLVAY